MTRDRQTIAIALTTLSIALFAGCGPSWKVVRQASPNPFVKHGPFGIEPMHYEGLRVGSNTEAAYLADKDEQARAGWEQDKAGIDQALRGGFQERTQGHALVAPGQDPFTLRPQITFIEPGTYNAFVNLPSRVEATLFILDAQGNVLDEIQFDASVDATITNPSVGGRLRTCGNKIGRQMADYVSARTGVE